MASSAIFASAIVSFAIIVPVILPVSPLVITVPETLGKVIVLSAVGSTTLKFVSNASAVAPSNIIPPVVAVV